MLWIANKQGINVLWMAQQNKGSGRSLLRSLAWLPTSPTSDSITALALCADPSISVER